MATLKITLNVNKHITGHWKSSYLWHTKGLTKGKDIKYQSCSNYLIIILILFLYLTLKNLALICTGTWPDSPLPPFPHSSKWHLSLIPSNHVKISMEWVKYLCITMAKVALSFELVELLAWLSLHELLGFVQALVVLTVDLGLLRSVNLFD